MKALAAGQSQRDTGVLGHEHDRTIHGNSNRAARYEIAAMHIDGAARECPVACGDTKMRRRGGWKQKKPGQSQHDDDDGHNHSSRNDAAGTPSGLAWWSRKRTR